MTTSMVQQLARVIEKAAEEGEKAEAAIRDEDAGLATKRLMTTLQLTLEALETLAEFDGPLGAIINLAPNVQVYVNALECVVARDFAGALLATRGTVQVKR